MKKPIIKENTRRLLSKEQVIVSLRSLRVGWPNQHGYFGQPMKD